MALNSNILAETVPGCELILPNFLRWNVQKIKRGLRWRSCPYNNDVPILVVGDFEVYVACHTKVLVSSVSRVFWGLILQIHGCERWLFFQLIFFTIFFVEGSWIRLLNDDQYRARDRPHKTRRKLDYKITGTIIVHQIQV